MARYNLGFDVTDEELGQLKTGLFKVMPNNEVDEEGNLIYDDVEWLREIIVRNTMAIVRQGLNDIADEQAQQQVDQLQGQINSVSGRVNITKTEDPPAEE